MYKSNQKLLWSNKEKIIVICDSCQKEFKITFKSGQKNLKKNGKHICCKCKGIELKPQNYSEYWDKYKKETQSNSIKNSDKYKESIKVLKKSGINNGMFNKKHSIDTINKMSKSRKGKIGVLATAWKGGKTSINRRAKHILQTRYNWFLRVLQRDNFTCQECGIKKNLDAHHIKPFSIIIKDIINNKIFTSETEKFNFIINHSEIIDEDLKNGKTLCRICHKKVHSNWGSHNAR